MINESFSPPCPFTVLLSIPKQNLAVYNLVSYLGVAIFSSLFDGNTVDKKWSTSISLEESWKIFTVNLKSPHLNDFFSDVYRIIGLIYSQRKWSYTYNRDLDGLRPGLTSYVQIFFQKLSSSRHIECLVTRPSLRQLVVGHWENWVKHCSRAGMEHGLGDEIEQERPKKDNGAVDHRSEHSSPDELNACNRLSKTI